MTDKKKITVRKATVAYAALREINAAKLPSSDKGDLFAIIRATRALKAVAEAQKDFEKDAAERLRPADFDALMEKREQFASLSPEEQRDVAARFRAYDKAFTECVLPEQEKEVEIDAFDPLSDSAISAIASASDNMPLDTLLIIEEVCR